MADESISFCETVKVGRDCQSNRHTNYGYITLSFTEFSRRLCSLVFSFIIFLKKSPAPLHPSSSAPSHPPAPHHPIQVPESLLGWRATKFTTAISKWVPPHRLWCLMRKQTAGPHQLLCPSSCSIESLCTQIEEVQLPQESQRRR